MSEDIRKFEPLWGKWYVTDVIGEGAFGRVYKIERKEFDNTYEAALKHIRIPQSQAEVKSVLADGMSKESAERYFYTVVKSIISEFVLMSKLKGNSNIVSYEDHDVVKDKNEIGWDIFIRMELLTGLIDYIQENDISKRQIIKLGIDICRALEICQKHNIIHRDIKPENIFVSENGDFKLGDFGIARQVEKTAAGLSKKGTFTYIAPEVYKGEAYGSTVDIYSLGIVMYRLLNNNRVPFMPPYPQPITYSDRESALVKRISGMPIEKPINANGRLAEIVLKACSYNPRERYESPRLMREELESILYTEMEAGVIYPQGDKAEIHSVNYLNTAENNTATMSFSQNAEEKTPLNNDFVEAFDDETKTMGADVFPADKSETVTTDFSSDIRKDKAKEEPVPTESRTEQETAEGKSSLNSTRAEIEKKSTAPVVKSGYGPERVIDNKVFGMHNEDISYPMPKKHFQKKLLIGIAVIAICLLAIHGIDAKYNKNDEISGNTDEETKDEAFVYDSDYVEEDFSGTVSSGTVSSKSKNNVAVDAGQNITAALKKDGTVTAIGDNLMGGIEVSDWRDIIAISSGSGYTVGLKSDGTVNVAGNYLVGTDAKEPEKWTNITAIAAGINSILGLKSDGTVVVSGSYSHIENNDTIIHETFDLNLADWTNIVGISAGVRLVAGVRADGTVVVYGHNPQEYQVSEWTDIVKADTCFEHIVGLKSDGTVVAEGNNENGQCDVEGWKDIVDVAAGYNHTVGLKSDGTVVAVGDNFYGQCSVGAWKDIVAISAGQDNTVGLKSDGTIVAIGKNDNGKSNVKDI